MKFLKKLFSHEKDVDNISDYSNWRVGLSCAASWSWGGLA